MWQCGNVFQWLDRSQLTGPKRGMMVMRWPSAANFTTVVNWRWLNQWLNKWPNKGLIGEVQFPRHGNGSRYELIWHRWCPVCCYCAALIDHLFDCGCRQYLSSERLSSPPHWFIHFPLKAPPWRIIWNRNFVGETRVSISALLVDRFRHSQTQISSVSTNSIEEAIFYRNRPISPSDL